MTRVKSENKTEFKDVIKKLIFIRPMLIFGAVVTLVVAAVLFLPKTFVLIIIAIVLGCILVFRSNKLYTLVYLLAVILGLFSVLNLSKKVELGKENIDNTYVMYAKTVKLGKSVYLYTDEPKLRFIHPINTKRDLTDNTNLIIRFKVLDFVTDYNYNLFSNGIIYSGILEYAEIDKNNHVNNILCDIESKKNDIINKMFINESSSHVGTLIGMIFSDRRYLTDIDSDIMLRTGLYHLLSVSGLHISIAFMLIMFMIRNLKFYKLKVILGIILGSILFILSQYSPSAYRAATIIIFSNLAMCFGRKSDSLNTLGLVVGIYILLNPLAIKDLSFLMTVFIYIMMVLFYKRVSNNIMKVFEVKKSLYNSRRFHNIVDSFSISVVAFLGVTPFSLLVFHNFSFVGYIVSFLVIPIMPFVLLFGYLGVISYWIGLYDIGKIVTHISVIFVRVILKIAEIFTKRDNFFINTIYPKNIMYAVLFITVTVLVFMFYSDIKFKNPYLKHYLYIGIVLVYALFFTFGVNVSGDYITFNKDTKSVIIDIDDKVCVIDGDDTNGMYRTRNTVRAINKELVAVVDGNYIRDGRDYRNIPSIYGIDEENVFSEYKYAINTLKKQKYKKVKYKVGDYVIERMSDNIILVSNKDYKIAWIMGDYGNEIERISMMLSVNDIDIAVLQNGNIINLSRYKVFNINNRYMFKLN